MSLSQWLMFAAVSNASGGAPGHRQLTNWRPDRETKLWGAVGLTALRMRTQRVHGHAPLSAAHMAASRKAICVSFGTAEFARMRRSRLSCLHPVHVLSRRL